MLVRTHITQNGVSKEDVLACHAAHPHWNAARIARELRCVSGYVRATLKRAGKTNPGHRPPPKKHATARVRIVAIEGSGPGAVAAAAQALRQISREPTRQESRNSQPYWNRD